MAPPNNDDHHAAPHTVPMWPRRTSADYATMTVHRPADRSRPHPAMLVFRGGGYARCDGSGAGTAEWLARHGIVGIEVPYATRATGAAFGDAYADAARAMRLVRHHATGWDIDPARIGAIGYSAGGHLVSLLSTQPHLPAPLDDDLAVLPVRPDLIVLAYPLISFVERYAPGAFWGSTESFFGELTVSEERRRQFSSELHVQAGHPPVFVWTTADDDIVPAAHSERFAEACRGAGVPVELVIYPHGPHAMGLALDQTSDVRTWTARMLAWLAGYWTL